jgi:peptide/nickel transport system substrate-binding protein
VTFEIKKNLEKVSKARSIANFIGNIGVGIFFLAVGILAVLVFMPDNVERFRADFVAYRNGDLHSSLDDSSTLRAVLPFVFESFEPSAFNTQSRQVLLNFYEPLVNFDKNLRLQPALAVSWGMIDEKTWEFRLRKDVRFHDGNFVTVEDVISSIDRAKNYFGSDLKALLSSVESFEKIDEGVLNIKTYRMDPSLPAKLSNVFILPAKYRNFLRSPIGTGPYYFVEREANRKIVLKRFDAYWGQSASTAELNLIFEQSAEKRAELIKQGEADFVFGLAPDSISSLRSFGVTVFSQPSLEVNFLLLNFRNSLLRNREVRQALRSVFDKKTFVEMTSGYARAANQFVSSGIFGFNPEIKPIEYEIDLAAKAVRQYGALARPVLSLHITEGMQVFGEYIKRQFNEIGVTVNLEYLSGKQLIESLKKGEADLYFFGWRSEMGDSMDFYESVVHSRQAALNYGIYNGINYANSQVDKLIESATRNLDVASRLQDLREVMRLIVEEDVIGVPLYESENIYAFHDDLIFEPRIDAYVYFADLKYQ